MTKFGFLAFAPYPVGSSRKDVSGSQVSHSTLSDDRGTKRMLYEDLGVSEYWIVDVAAAAIACFEMLEGGGSRRVRESVVLPGLTLDVLEAALRQSRGSDHGQVSAWLLTQWQNNP